MSRKLAPKRAKSKAPRLPSRPSADERAAIAAIAQAQDDGERAKRLPADDLADAADAARRMIDMLSVWERTLRDPDAYADIQKVYVTSVWNLMGCDLARTPDASRRLQVFVRAVRRHAIGTDATPNHASSGDKAPPPPNVAVITPRRAARNLVDEFARQFPQDARAINLDALAQALGGWHIRTPGRTQQSKYALLEEAIAKTSFAMQPKTIEEAVRRAGKAPLDEPRKKETPGAP